MRENDSDKNDDLSYVVFAFAFLWFIEYFTSHTGSFSLFYPSSLVIFSLDIKEQDDDGMYAEEKEEEIEMLEGFEEIEEAGEFIYTTVLLHLCLCLVSLPYFEKKILNIFEHCNQNISHTNLFLSQSLFDAYM